MASDPLDVFRTRERFHATKDGWVWELTKQLREADAYWAYQSGDCPHRGDTANGLYCNNVEIERVEGSAADSENHVLYEITATFGPLDKSPTAGKARWSLNGQSEQVKRFAVDGGADHQDYPLESGSAPGAQEGVYNGQGINVTEHGAEGVDVDAGFETLKIDLWKAPADTPAFLNVIRALANTVNQDDFAGPWGTYAAGECRLPPNGYSVAHVDKELDQISLEFQARKNVTFQAEVAGGEGPFNVDKEGHQYYWQRCRKITATDDEKKNKVEVVDVHVDTVYRPGDFSTLGITWDMFDLEEPS
jgi:hypothetical protein